MKFESKYIIFHLWQCIWQRLLWNGGHFVQGEKREIIWGRATHICVGNLTIIGSVNGLSPGRRQAIIWANAVILSIGPLGTNFGEILIKIIPFSFKKMRSKVSSGKRRPSWDYYLGILSCNEVLSMTHLKVGQIKSMGALSSNEPQWLDIKTGYQDSCPRIGHQGDLPRVHLQWNRDCRVLPTRADIYGSWGCDCVRSLRA